MMKHRAVVLGCGRIGAVMVRDLAADADFEVTAVDVHDANLRPLASVPRVSTAVADLSDPAQLQRLAVGHDVVIGALPSRMGFRTLQAVIETGTPYCDISFMPEDAMQLDQAAREHSATAIVDCGFAPGLSNLIVGHVHRQLDAADRVLICVGGLPKVRCRPFEYKAPFAPSDVIEEYVRPARVVRNGRVVVVPALSEPEFIDFPEVGTLEAFITDGLRSLVQTLSIPEMTEKTLRYPGHCELMRAFRAAGFFDEKPIRIGESEVRPIDVSAELLSNAWKFEEGELDFTVMRIVIDGNRAATVRERQSSVRHVFDLFDEYDRTTGFSSMARTTGFPATILARLLARGELHEPGVFPPERLAGHKGLFDHVCDELRRRGVQLLQRTEPIPTVDEK